MLSAQVPTQPVSHWRLPFLSWHVDRFYISGVCCTSSQGSRLWLVSIRWQSHYQLQLSPHLEGSWSHKSVIHFPVSEVKPAYIYNKLGTSVTCCAKLQANSTNNPSLLLRLIVQAPHLVWSPWSGWCKHKLGPGLSKSLPYKKAKSRCSEATTEPAHLTIGYIQRP